MTRTISLKESVRFLVDQTSTIKVLESLLEVALEKEQEWLDALIKGGHVGKFESITIQMRKEVVMFEAALKGVK